MGRAAPRDILADFWGWALSVPDGPTWRELYWAEIPGFTQSDIDYLRSDG